MGNVAGLSYYQLTRYLMQLKIKRQICKINISKIMNLTFYALTTNKRD